MRKPKRKRKEVFFFFKICIKSDVGVEAEDTYVINIDWFSWSVKKKQKEKKTGINKRDHEKESNVWGNVWGLFLVFTIYLFYWEEEEPEWCSSVLKLNVGRP